MSHSLSDLGARLRAIRTEHGWRIADVSRMTGLAGSTISKVENGQMSLTYDKLLQLVNGLNLDFSVLFSAAPVAAGTAQVTARRSVGRAQDIAYVDVEGYGAYGYLNTDIAHKKMTPILGETKARNIEEFGDLLKHPGEEFIYVLDGVLEVHTEFYSPTTLKPGEFLYIDSSMGHAYLSAGEGPSRFICVCTGESSESTLEVLRAIGGVERAADADAGGAKKPTPPRRTPSRARPKGRT
jgi:transcriptional regulator with XRE-family HTH domain